jgi:hypothetical protein
MKLKDARDLYYFNSGKTSDLVRQLALAGIAIIWIFRYEVDGTPKIPQPFATPLILIGVGLALDLLQYALATAVWGIFQRRKELGGTLEEADFKAPRQFNWPTIVLFAAKVSTIAWAYFLLLQHLGSTLR